MRIGGLVVSYGVGSERSWPSWWSARDGLDLVHEITLFNSIGFALEAVVAQLACDPVMSTRLGTEVKL
jgi:hypothetical protein